MVKRTERGWAGHFICSDSCLFRRNTLIEARGKKIVVSTVGLMRDPLKEECFTVIGWNRYYETMAFYSNKKDRRYHDADVSREVTFESPWSISEVDADDKANLMHDTVVTEIVDKLERGEKL
jgi:hypothetical protein